MMRRPQGSRRLVSVRATHVRTPRRPPARLHDAWWLSWALGIGALFGIGFVHLAVDVARAGSYWSIAPIAFLYGWLAYYVMLGCVRRTSWLQERHIRRMRRLMAR